MTGTLDRIEAFWASDRTIYDGPDITADMLALVEVAKAARERRCNRFDITPCSERPELDPRHWCRMCAALARLEDNQ